MVDRKEASSANEGEGSRTAANEYNKDTREFIKKGKVEPAAEEARKDLDGPEGADLRRAEDEGRSHAKS